MSRVLHSIYFFTLMICVTLFFFTLHLTFSISVWYNSETNLRIYLKRWWAEKRQVNDVIVCDESSVESNKASYATHKIPFFSFFQQRDEVGNSWKIRHLKRIRNVQRHFFILTVCIHGWNDQTIGFTPVQLHAPKLDAHFAILIEFRSSLPRHRRPQKPKYSLYFVAQSKNSYGGVWNMCGTVTNFPICTIAMSNGIIFSFVFWLIVRLPYLRIAYDLLLYPHKKLNEKNFTRLLCFECTSMIFLWLNKNEQIVK